TPVRIRRRRYARPVGYWQLAVSRVLHARSGGFDGTHQRPVSGRRDGQQCDNGRGRGGHVANRRPGLRDCCPVGAQLMSHMTGGQAVVAALKADGVDTVFGMPACTTSPCTTRCVTLPRSSTWSSVTSKGLVLPPMV